jgi:uncharacterized protein YaiE (UPF0345 family)
VCLKDEGDGVGDGFDVLMHDAGGREVGAVVLEEGEHVLGALEAAVVSVVHGSVAFRLVGEVGMGWKNEYSSEQCSLERYGGNVSLFFPWGRRK